MNETLEKFSDQLIKEVAEGKPIISARGIKTDAGNNICSLYTTQIEGRPLNYGGIAYAYAQTTGYGSNAQNEIRITISKGENSFSVHLEVGTNITKEILTSELFVSPYNFDSYTSYKSKIIVTKELLQEYGEGTILNIFTRECLALLDIIEDIFNTKKYNRYLSLSKEYEEKRETLRNLISSLSNKSDVAEKKITKETLIENITSTNLTQEQLDNIQEIIQV